MTDSATHKVIHDLKVVSDAGNNAEFGRFVLEPLEKGFGTMVGNSFRRVLLSSVPGTCISSVKIDGVLHEFSAIPGVVEDVSEIVLNLKRLVLRSVTDGEVRMQISAPGPKQVTAADILPHQSVKVMQPNTYICEITDPNTTFNMEMVVNRGTGYRSATAFEQVNTELNTILVDQSFCPVKRVTFKVEDINEDSDRLILDVTTNGGCLPEEAMRLATKILMQHLDVLSEFEVETRFPNQEFRSVRDESRPEERAADILIKDVEFSVRSRNCLEQENIKTLGELASRRASELLAIKNFGRKSLTEVREKLGEYGLALKDEEVTKA